MATRPYEPLADGLNLHTMGKFDNDFKYLFQTANEAKNGDINFINGSIGNIQLADGSVTNSKIGDRSVHNRNIADLAVRENHIAGMSVTELKLANFAVTQNKIAAEAVTNSKIADRSIHNRNIADIAVRENHIAGGAVTPIKISTDSNGINKGKVYPLKVVLRDAAFEPYDREISNVILSAKVIGARKDKMYSIQYIANGINGYYGITLAEWNKTSGGGIISDGKRELIDFKDPSFNHNEPASDIIHRTIHIPNEDLSFEIIYDRSEITAYPLGLDIANTTIGKGRSTIIHPENYVYRMSNTIVSESTSTSKVFMDKSADSFIVYEQKTNGNYIGTKISFNERGIDTTNALSNYKLWSLRTIKEYSRDGDTFTPVRSIIDDSVVTTMDLMVRESPDMDYMGGLNHGDEVNDYVLLLVDGKPVSLSSTGFYAAKEIKLVQRNKLYRDTVYTNGELNHLATVGKEHIFNADGYTLKNRLTWHESINVVESYLGSLSLYRADEKGNSPLWHTVINDITHTPYDLKVIGGQMPAAEDAESVIILGENMSCTVGIDRLNNIPGNKIHVANFAEPNSKLYISHVPANYTTTVGEVWKQSNNFKFELN